MSKRRSGEVPVQKGTIVANHPTYREMPYSDRVRERQDELRHLRKGQQQELKTPKK
jgi:hypothetical protein